MPVVYRAVILYIWSILLLRLMGKSLTFQQKPYDFVVMMLIGSASAALIVNREVPLLNAMVALLVLAMMQTMISLASLNNYLKRFLGGQPDILIRNGRLVKANLFKNQINTQQLLSALRNKGYRSPSEVEFAIIEPSGQLSVIPKSQNRPVTANDLGIQTGYEGIPTPLIIDGKVQKIDLTAVGLDKDWLRDQLRQRELSPEQVYLALLDTDGTLYVAEEPPMSMVKAFFVGEGRDHRQGEVR